VLSAFEDIVRQSGQIARQARKQMVREIKLDGSIVTNGDREVETYLRDVLPKLRPNTTIWGEEFGHDDPGPAGLWLLDPVDGTSNYAYGSPLWGVSVALWAEGALQLGAVFLPDLDELYMAQIGGGATCNGVPMSAVPEGPIGKIELISYSENLIRAFPGQRWPGKMRCSGAFVIDAMFVARQRFRGLIGIRGKLYDVAASLLILEELNAEVRYMDGSPLVVDELLDEQTIPRPYIVFPKGSDFRVDGP
jgi:myo-inositol-1(or 4)-monophosphatase